MSKEKEITRPLTPGQEYKATIKFVSVGGEGKVSVKVTRTPANYLENLSDDEYVQIPAAWDLANRMLEQLEETLEREEEHIKASKPKLTVVQNETLN